MGWLIAFSGHTGNILALFRISLVTIHNIERTPMAAATDPIFWPTLQLLALYLGCCLLGLALLIPAPAAWRRENAKISSLPLLSPEAVAILCGGRSHFLWVSLLQHSQQPWAPTTAGRIIGDTNADNISWDHRNAELETALTQLKHHGLWRLSALRAGGILSLLTTTASVCCIVAWLIFLPLWILVTAVVCLDILHLRPDDFVSYIFGWIMWVILFYPLFTPLAKLSDLIAKYSNANPQHPLIGISGIVSGQGHDYVRNIVTLQHADSRYLTAIFGKKYLQSTHPELISQYEWILAESFAAEERKRAQYRD